VVGNSVHRYRERIVRREHRIRCTGHSWLRAATHPDAADKLPSNAHMKPNEPNIFAAWLCIAALVVAWAIVVWHVLGWFDLDGP
jgi:hypothetical protein